MPNITKVYGGRATVTFNEARHQYTVTVPGVVERMAQPSVTGIIGKLDKSGALVPWAVGQMSQRIKNLLQGVPVEQLDRDALWSIIDAAEDSWRQVKNEAADIGSLAHRVLEQELLYRSGLATKPAYPVTFDAILAPNLTEEMVEKANNSIQAGLEFLDTHHIEVVQAEAPRWSPTYGYIGTGDLIARVDGDLSVLDWKTSKRLYATVFLQLAAYQVAYEEEFPGQRIERRIGINIGRDGVLETQERDNSTLDRDFRTFIALRDIYRWDCENQGKYSKPAHRILGPLSALEVSR